MRDFTDEELLHRVAQDADHEAFEALDRRYRGRLRSFILGQCKDPLVADDITEETLVRVFLHAGKYRPLATVSTWLFTIATNCLRNHWRRAQRHPLHLQLEPCPDDDDVAPLDPPDPTADPSQAVARLELGCQLTAAMASLPGRYRRPLELWADGWAYQDIADAMGGIPVGTVRSRIHRARSLVRLRLDRAA